MSINERFDLVLVLAPTQANQSPVMEPMSLGGSERFERISYPSEIVLVCGCKCHNPEAAFGGIPADVTFPPDYRISDTRIRQLVQRALDREVALEARQLKRVWGARLEETWAFLYPKMRRGDTRAIEVGMKVAERAAKLWGLDAPAKLAIKGDESTTLTIVQVRDLLLADVVEVEAKRKSAALAIEERGELIEASEEAERAEEREKPDPEVRAGLPEETEAE
jgi:hypothetical protein